MNCTLMHKEIAVANLEVDEHTGLINKITDVIEPKHFPIGTYIKGMALKNELNDWWVDRSIPASRSGITKALDILGLSNTKSLLVKCFGLSLSDQYWIKPSDMDLDWKDINFFDNAFSEDIGNVLLGKSEKAQNFDFCSPDNTSDGCLKKSWKIIDGKRCMIKGGSAPFMQQPFNEVIATKIMELLDIPHIPYELIWDDGKPYSVCPDFITRDTELISAWRVMKTQKQYPNISVYQHYCNCSENLGVSNIKQMLDKMIVLDYIIANEDRHQNNFGLIRNADTLEFIGVAPIFDSGSSLGYNKLTSRIESGIDIDCKPFKKTHKQQLQLVTSFDWINFDKLKAVDAIIRDTFQNAGEFADSSRIDAIVASVENRITKLQEFALSHIQITDNVLDDVDEDIAEDYTMKFNM